MVENMDKFWTINDLMKRYGINRASMTEYAKSKIDIINKDGVHAKKSGKEWQFNAEAVRILDELRGYGTVIENYDSPEKARIAELEKELEEARTFMAAAQAENSRQKDKIIELLEEKAEAVKLLACAEADRKMAENDVLRLSAVEADLEKAEADNKLKADKIAELQATGERKEQAISELEAKNAEVQRELQTTKTALVAEQNKSLWQVIKEKVLGK